MSDKKSAIMAAWLIISIYFITFFVAYIANLSLEGYLNFQITFLTGADTLAIPIALLIGAFSRFIPLEKLSVVLLLIFALILDLIIHTIVWAILPSAAPTINALASTALWYYVAYETFKQMFEFLSKPSTESVPPEQEVP